MNSTDLTVSLVSVSGVLKQYMNMRAWSNGTLKAIGVVWINNMEQ